MLDLYADLAAVFFGPDFAAPYTRRRPGAADITIMLVTGAVDEKALDGRAMSAVRVAHFAAGQDVLAGDKLLAQQASPDAPAGTAYRVLDAPARLNDGLEIEVLLGSASA
jgi:hypothetical protein